MSGAGRVGVGVIGAGVISSQYLQNLTAFPDLDVRFIADLDRDRARVQAAAFGVPASGSVDELLADDGIEIVVNLTIPAAHVEVGLQILHAGKHVWAEKPLALDRPSAQALLDAAASRGLRVASAPDTFLGAGLQTARRLVDEGRIGTPLRALAIFENAGPESWHPNPEFYFAPGGGPLLDMAPYYLTALVQLLGPVARVTATASTARATRLIGSGPKAGVEIPVTVPTFHSALVQFEGGGSAQTIFSFDGPRRYHPLIEIGGSVGTLEVPDPNGFTGASQLWAADADAATEIAAVGATTGRGSGVLELARAIRAGCAERASGELAFHVLDTMLAIAESAEESRTVDVRSTVARPEALPIDWDPTAATL